MTALLALALLIKPESATGRDTEETTSSRVLLLGTAGGPRIVAERSLPATAIVVGGRVYLFDVGYGTLRQLERAKLPLASIAGVFITHNHFDHNADLGALLAFSWHAGRPDPIRIYGPPGTSTVTADALDAFGHSIAIFNSETPRSAPEVGRNIVVQEIARDGPFYSDGSVTVSAAENSHFANLRPGSPAYQRDKSFSYRIETPEGSVVISGDTGKSEALDSLAAGADVLVSEVLDERAIARYIEAWATRDNLSARTAAEALAHMVDGHLSSAEVGRIAATAGVCRLVLTHFVPSATADGAKLAADIREIFSGEVIAGQDLMSLPVHCRAQGKVEAP